MAMQSGIGISKILILAGAGYTGTLLFQNGKLSDLLGELQALVKGLESSGNPSDGSTDYSEAMAAQVRHLAMEVRRLASSQHVAVINGNSSQIGTLTSMIIPAATAGALGYGYMWWKGLSFSDLMYVTKRNMTNAVASLTKNLENVSEALSAAKQHLTQRIEKLDGKMDDQRKISKDLNNNVCMVKANLEDLGNELTVLQRMVSGLDWRMDSLDDKQDWANEGVKYLCGVVNGQKVEVPRILQEQLKISGAPRGLLTNQETGNGFKNIFDSLPQSIEGQDTVDKLSANRRPLLRTSAVRLISATNSLGTR